MHGNWLMNYQYTNAPNVFALIEIMSYRLCEEISLAPCPHLSYATSTHVSMCATPVIVALIKLSINTNGD
jgi:hypothetical protein